MAFPENVQKLVAVAATYALDGAPFTAVDWLHKAADALSAHAIAAGQTKPNAVRTLMLERSPARSMKPPARASATSQRPANTTSR